MSKDLIVQSTECYALNPAVDGSEDGQIHSIRAGQPCENAADKLQSQHEMLFEPKFDIPLATTMM